MKVVYEVHREQFGKSLMSYHANWEFFYICLTNTDYNPNHIIKH